MELGLSSVRRMQFSYFPVLPLGGAVCNFHYWKLASDVQRLDCGLCGLATTALSNKLWGVDRLYNSLEALHTTATSDPCGGVLHDTAPVRAHCLRNKVY